MSPSILCSILCTLMAASTRPAPNPAYLAWADFKPGSSVTLSTITMRGDAKMSDVRTTLRLVEVRPDRVILESSGSMEAGDSRLQFPPDRVEIAATLPAARPGEGPTAGEASETIEVAGQKVRTRRIRQVRRDGQIITETTSWLSQAIPGGLAQQRITVTGEDPTETTVEVLSFEAK